MADIVAELRRKIGDRDGDDGVIGVTFGEMRSLLDAVEAARAYRQSEAASKIEFYEPDVSDQRWLAAMAKRYEDQEELDNALAALERSDAE